MSIDPPQDDPTAPPTVPFEPPSPVRVSNWPHALGIICIVLSVSALLVYGLSLPQMLLSAKAMQLPGMTAELGELIARYMPRLVFKTLLLLALAGLLLVGAIGLVRRRRWSVKLIRVWAGLKIIAAVVGAVIDYGLQKEQVAIMSGSGGVAFNNPLLRILPELTVSAMLAWYWALPVFMLIWLNRAKIREEVREWSAGRSGLRT